MRLTRRRQGGRAALFVLPGTGATLGKPLGCMAGAPATLSLSNLGAGDYTIVVASLNSAAMKFGVTLK